MIVHSPIDEMVPYSDAIKIFNQAKTTKNFLSVDNANHIFTNNEDSIFAGRVISEWLKRYV
jgi:putative redox protein